MKALGVDLALRSVGLALVSPGDKIEGLAVIQVPGLEMMDTYDFLMEGYRLNQRILRAASVIFIERPTTGLLAGLVHAGRTSVLSIEAQALGRLIFLLALRELDLTPELYVLDPGKIAQSTRNLVLTEELKQMLGHLKLKKAKFMRRAWLLLNAPTINWADGAITEHESDAAHLACVGLHAYLFGQIEALGGRKQLV